MLEFNYNDSVEDMLPCRERSHVIEAKSIKEKFKVIDVNGGEMLGDAGLFNQEAEKYRAVTRQDIQNTARELFAPHRKNTLYYLSKK